MSAVYGGKNALVCDQNDQLFSKTNTNTRASFAGTSTSIQNDDTVQPKRASWSPKHGRVTLPQMQVQVLDDLLDTTPQQRQSQPPQLYHQNVNPFQGNSHFHQKHQLRSYQKQAQTFLQHAAHINLANKPSFEETVELERQKLTKAPAQQLVHAQEEKQNLKSMTPAFVWRLGSAHSQPLAPPASTIPIRKHHLEPLMTDDEYVSSEAVLSRANSVASSGTGVHPQRERCRSIDSGATSPQSVSGLSESQSASQSAAFSSTKDVRDDEKYIGSSNEDEESGYRSNSDATGQQIERLTREFCRRLSSQEEQDRQASSPVEEDHSLEKRHKHKKKHQKPEPGDDGKTPTRKNSKKRHAKEGVEMKTKETRKKSKDHHHRKRRNSKEDEYLKRYLKELEYDRAMLMAEWKNEFKRVNQDDWDGDEDDEYYKGGMMYYCCTKCFDPCYQSIVMAWSFAEVFLANMPITIAAVGLSWVTQGTIWFKFMEENIDACTTARFNSNRCTFGEFPGCFECDTSNPIYLAALTFHYFCHSVAFTCCMLFLLKVFVAGRVVVDELCNPATSSPMGIVCITLECIFAGLFGKVGESIVIGVSIFHVILSFWFCYMAIFKFHLLPDPSWYPNCIGLAYAAVKSWLYYPWVGKSFMVLCIFYFFTMFFIGTIRVATNHKIAAPVCFIGLSAPSITMYAMTIMAQPSLHREEKIEANPQLMGHFEKIHHDLYIPVMHCMMLFSLMGMASALRSLYERWPTFKYKEFSPAHFAFIFPILSHTNAVQAYRSGVDSFAGIPIGNPFKLLLFNYWFLCLIVGTTANFIFTAKYIRRLPKWTKIDISEEEEQPPSPSHTVVHDVMYESDAHETILSQHFVSPAVLQANETGQLVRLRRGTEEWDKYGPYVRTRHVAAFGFDLPMTDLELRQERAELLHWVAMNAPRKRNRTLSHNEAFQTLLPSVLHSGREGAEQYGSLTARDRDENPKAPPKGHSRHNTHHF